MADRFSVAQKVLVGVEPTPGATTVANKRLLAMGFSPSVNAEVDKFVPMGAKFPTVEAEGREWASSAMSGRPTFTEIIYPLSMILQGSTPTIGTPTVGSNTWTFTPNPDAPDPIKTLRTERGDSTGAERAIYTLLTEFNLNVTRQAAEIAGQTLAQALETGVTLVASPTSMALVPILAKQFSFYLDNTSIGLGVTKYTRVLRVNFAIGNRFGPVWVVDAAQPSFAAHAELLPNFRIELRLGADVAGLGLLTKLRSGSTIFGRLEAIGPVIGATVTPYSMMVNSAFKVANMANMGDTDGIYGVDLTLDVVFDGAYGKACEVVVVNDVAAL